ncbi:MAG: dihydropteroate synthase, partial [Defluviitaleaceae bacterium]|nr:dihydropteroate synthase [Defluviitaleaceae bacterium]
GADILTAVNVVQSLGAAAIGLNCGAGPAQMRGLIGQVLENTDIPVICSPNGGLPRVVGGETVFDIDAAEFARQMAEIAALGVTHLGGCCGTTPAHIAAMIAACAEITPPARIVKKTTRISSYGKTVEFGKKMIIIGERINPTGKARLKQALRENNMEYVLREGLAQIAEGADILDVNAGMPGIDEAASLARAVAALQSIVPTPLCIDTANIAAAEAALRVYNGKPLLNSVSGKSESMAAILPLAKKYGAAVVALALDDDGIPETAEGRAAIVDKIIKCAAEYGISKSNIVMDALTLTISTGADNARVTLEGLDRARDLGVCTILGVSNISFGLPARHTLNAGFLTLAANRGLSAAIINTAHKPMMDAVFIHNLLAGLDENAAEYIGRFSEQTEMAAEKADMTLFDAILHGLCDVARDSVKILLNNEDSLNIINQHLIPALDKAGQDFAAQKIFLPQLLMSAAAAKAAFEAISAHMLAKGQQTKKRGKIILATVKGDIHDIGKNIVKVLLENYNFEVIDLGKNVAPEAVLDAAIAQGADLVGLSALMTTTVVYMEQTIALLRQKAPGIPIMVGGAVLTQSYADQIGADFYSPDAMGAVRYASEIIGE